MKLRLLALAIAGTTLAGTATATPYAPFDVRAAGMGGTGVASAKSASAALFNPAMLSSQVEGDKFQFVLGAGATVADEDNLFDQVDEMQTSIDTLNALINHPSTTTDLQGLTLNTAYAPASNEYRVMTTAAAATLDLATRLGKLHNDSLIAGLGTGLGFGVPGPKLGVGVFITGSANVVTTPMIAGADLGILQRFSDVLGDGQITTAELVLNSDIVLPVLSNPGQIDINTFSPDSQVNGLAIAQIEYGVSFSHRFDLADAGALAVGVTPKLVTVTTYDYTQGVDNFEDSDIDTLEKTEDTFDLDIGATYKASPESAWQYGVVVKHLIGGDFTTNPNLIVTGTPNAADTISVEPQLRVGAARMTNRSTLAVDLDVTENAGASPGTATQFLAFGAEYDLKFLQLRAGYRANLAESDVSDVATVGLGLGPIDLSAVASDGSLGAYLQLGFGW
jgi:hypothetical protein